MDRSTEAKLQAIARRAMAEAQSPSKKGYNRHHFEEVGDLTSSRGYRNTVAMTMEDRYPTKVG